MRRRRRRRAAPACRRRAAPRRRAPRPRGPELLPVAEAYAAAGPFSPRASSSPSTTPPPAGPAPTATRPAGGRRGEPRWPRTPRSCHRAPALGAPRRRLRRLGGRLLGHVRLPGRPAAQVLGDAAAVHPVVHGRPAAAAVPAVVRADGHGLRIAVAGSVDTFSADRLAPAARDAPTSTARCVALDLSRVTFIDVAGAARRRRRRPGGRRPWRAARGRGRVAAVPADVGHPRLRRRRAGVLRREPPVTATPPRSGPHREPHPLTASRHEALFYRGDAEFLGRAVRRSSARGSRPARRSWSPNRRAGWRCCRTPSGTTPAPCELLDMAEIGANPARIIGVWATAARPGTRGGTACCAASASPPSPAAGPELAECHAARAAAQPGVRRRAGLAAAVPLRRGARCRQRGDRRAAHAPPVRPPPAARGVTGAATGPRLTTTWPPRRSAPLPPQAGPSCAGVRPRRRPRHPPHRRARGRARAGCPRTRSRCWSWPPRELATNSIRHGGGAGTVAMWIEPGAAVVEFSDAGPVADRWPGGGRRRPTAAAGALPGATSSATWCRCAAPPPGRRCASRPGADHPPGHLAEADPAAVPARARWR